MNQDDPLEEGMALYSPAFMPGESHVPWWATVHMVIKSGTRLSDSHFHTFTILPVAEGKHPHRIICEHGTSSLSLTKAGSRVSEMHVIW